MDNTKSKQEIRLYKRLLTTQLKNGDWRKKNHDHQCGSYG